MKIEHIAIWVNNLNEMKNFYTKYFNMSCSKIYTNTKKGFSSHFLSFENGARIEIMHRNDIYKNKNKKGWTNGLTHFSISVGGKENVDLLTEKIRKDGFYIFGEPRFTGDGCYESVISDPEGNHIEITA